MILYPPFDRQVGQDKITFRVPEGITVGRFLEGFAAAYPQLGDTDGLLVLVNGLVTPREGQLTASAGTIKIIPAVAGG